MDGRQRHNNLGLVFGAKRRGPLICEGCNHVVFSALLKGRVMWIYVALCIAHFLFTLAGAMIDFHTFCTREEKSK